MVSKNIHQVEIIQTGLDHSECVNFGPDGRLYAGGVGGQVYVLTPPKFQSRQLTSTHGLVLGVAVDGNHNVYACDAVRHCVFRSYPEGRDFSIL